MTRRVRARSANVSSEGQVTPYSMLGFCSFIRMSLNRGMSLNSCQIVVVKAGARSGVAGSADLVDPDEQSVTVAVQSHALDVLSVALDCDGDALLVRVDQIGAACHTGARTCFDDHDLAACLLYTSPSPRDGLLSRMP